MHQFKHDGLDRRLHYRKMGYGLKARNLCCQVLDVSNAKGSYLI